VFTSNWKTVRFRGTNSFIFCPTVENRPLRSKPSSKIDNVHYLLRGANRSPHAGHSMATATALVNHLILYNVLLWQIPRGNNGKPNWGAPAASCRAQTGAVAGREVRSSNLSDRVVKRYGNNQAGKPTDPNNIAGFTAQDGTGATSEMGKGSQRITANGDSENNGLGSCAAIARPVLLAAATFPRRAEGSTVARSSANTVA
jgi:hypothetical protein